MSGSFYAFAQLADISGGEVIPGSPETRFFSQIAWDSRLIADGTSTVFFALRGKARDGQQFVAQAYAKGVRMFVVSDEPAPELFPGADFLRVENPLQTLQDLTAYHRRQFNLPVIAITGSNGKTVVKEWLNQLLAEDESIVRSPRSYNSQLGVPLSVWLLDKRHTLGIFEAGISESGEMDALERIITPELGFYLNLGTAHLENFRSPEALAAEKAKLFRHSRRVFASADYPLIQSSLRDTGFTGELITWSALGREADLQLLESDPSEHFSELRLNWRGRKLTVSLPFTDRASQENALACIAFLLCRGTDEGALREKLLRLAPVAMRMEVVEGIGGSRLINDSYSSDLRSLEIALQFQQQQSKGRRKVVIISDMLQTGIPESELYAELSNLLSDYRTDLVLAVGEAICRNAGAFGTHTVFYRNTGELLEAVAARLLPEDIVLVKGSRDFRFERVIHLLQEKAHDTVLEVDLGKMAYNLNIFRSRLQPGAALMAMVKAFSYGTGGVEIARLLEFHGVNYLGVAYTDEGVNLRRAGISVPIVVMNPERSGMEALVRYRLEPEIYSLSSLRRIAAEIAKHAPAQPWPVHIKIDTGMNRLGFDPGEMALLAQEIKTMPFLEVRSVFSHLAAAENPEHDDFTRSQIELFRRSADELSALLGVGFIRHIANTAGICRFPEAHFDMVRLGIGLYGIDVCGAQPLQTVSTLRTVVSQIKQVEPGHSVGYGRAFLAAEKTTIAVIPIGYADGFRRSLSQGKGRVLINGRCFPVAGNVCMDMSMIDVTGSDVREGDAVVIFGEGNPIEQLAAQMGTIPYEVLTSVPPRVKRIFIQE